MGSTRLAVLDLSPAGEQPMTTADGRFTIVYNGEITNYVELRADLVRAGTRLRSGSDTEVLLEAWAARGEACLDALEGMYAFAVLDRSDATLSLCRDAFGIKPLYFHAVPGLGMAFGSEVAAMASLLPGRQRLNWATAVRYLSSGYYDDGEGTFIEGVGQLAPGAGVVLDIRSGTLARRAPRWRPSIATDRSITPEQAAAGVRERFLVSVERNLRSDVPVGVALSGGIDSSAIACGIRQVAPDYPLRVFSFISSDAATDESRWVDLAQEGLAAQAWSVRPTAADLSRDVDELITAQGEPFGSTSIYAQYRVFRLMHEEGVVVSLDGQGGDELFAGYQGYLGQRVRSLVEERDLAGALSFARAWSHGPGRSSARALALAGAEFAPSNLARAVARRRAAYAPSGIKWDRIRERGLPWGWSPVSAPADGQRGVRVKAELRSSLTERGVQALLRHGDRSSMRFSVESRVPFLDRALTDYVLSLPEQYLVDRRGTTKAVLRQAMRGIVPEAILDRKDKIGFESDDHSWIDSQRRRFADDIAAGPEIGFLDRRAVLSAVDPTGPWAAAGASPMPARPLWRLFNLYRWADLHGIDCT